MDKATKKILIWLDVGCRSIMKFNKAVYTAALVADGWAGAENLEKQFCDRRTDGQTDGSTDGRTDGPKSGL